MTIRANIRAKCPKVPNEPPFSLCSLSCLYDQFWCGCILAIFWAIKFNDFSKTNIVSFSLFFSKNYPKATKLICFRRIQKPDFSTIFFVLRVFLSKNGEHQNFSSKKIFFSCEKIWRGRNKFQNFRIGSLGRLS